MIKGWAVTSGGVNVRGPLSDDEFNRLTPVLGIPRYYRTSNATLESWPFINAPDTISIVYVSENWLSGDKKEISQDTDLPLFDDEILMQGALWRFKRMKGYDFTDQLAKFEASLSIYSSFARPERV
jgi:hypothetical protein